MIPRTKVEKKNLKTLIANYAKSFVEEIHKEIDEDKLPDDWDGLELRALLMFRVDRDVAAQFHNRPQRRRRAYRAIRQMGR